MKLAVGCILRAFGNNKELFAKVVAVKNIIGFRENGNGNVRNVDFELNYEAVPWVHIAISNAKRTLLGIYHKIKGKYLQLYLDKFCHILNRRYFGERLFDSLTIAMTDNYRYNNG